MPAGQNLRVVISCVTFETVMIVKPIQYYRADRAYLLHRATKAPYSDFLNEVEAQLKPIVSECVVKEFNINNFRTVMKEVIGIIKKEKELGNHVYVNIGAGPNVFSAAALIACMMEGAVAFNVGTKEYTVNDPKVFYVEGKPVGMAKDTYDPYPLPEFEIKAPKIELVGGLRAWQKLSEQKGIMSTPNIIRKLEREGLMNKIFDHGEHVSQAAVMKFRRNFLDPWVKNEWIQKDGRKLNLTEKGKSILEIFN